MLTTKQFEVISHFWKVGQFMVNELRVIYTSDKSITSCIERLQALGLIRFNGQRYEINRGEFLEFQKTHE